MNEIIRMGGVELRFLQGKAETGASLDLFEVTLQPNANMPVPHYHRDWDETVYGLRGTSRWTVAGEGKDVGPGESLFIPSGAVHAFDNRTQEAVTCLCVLTPGVLDPQYFREMAAEVEGGSPDPGRLREIMLRYGLIPSGPG